IFDQQCQEWISRLRWDYTEPSRLLRGVLRKGELTGLIAITNPAMGDPAASGFSFYVVEGTRASIGDIYVSEPHRGVGIDKQLLLSILSKLETLPRLRRIESQSVSFGNQGADEIFLSRGFERFERRFMMAPLSPDSIPESAQGAPAQLATGP